MRTFDPIKGEFVENSGPAAELPVLRRTPSWFEIMLNQARARRDAMAQQAMEAFESGGIQGALGHAYAMTRPDPNPNAAAIFAALGGGAVAATSPFPFGRGLKYVGPPVGGPDARGGAGQARLPAYRRAGGPRVRRPVVPLRLGFNKARSEPEFVYHATNSDNLRDIADSGFLDVFDPWHGTDQSEWPDRSTEKRAYFGGSAENIMMFAPEHGTPVVIRLKRGPSIKRESTGDFYVNKPVPASELEYLGEDQTWHPLLEIKSK